MKKVKTDLKSFRNNIDNNDPSILKDRYEIKGIVWIEGKEGTFLGLGRVILLERIREYGSISEAAKSMSMSYRHAWELVKSMNRQSRTALVETVTGGRGGGGARLTGAGEVAIEMFWKLYRDFKSFLGREVKRIGLL